MIACRDRVHPDFDHLMQHTEAESTLKVKIIAKDRGEFVDPTILRILFLSFWCKKKAELTASEVRSNIYICLKRQDTDSKAPLVDNSKSLEGSPVTLIATKDEEPEEIIR